MLPQADKTKKDESLFASVQWHMMYAAHTMDDAFYRSARTEFLKHCSRLKLEETEHKVVNSASLQKFLSNRGVEGRITK